MKSIVHSLPILLVSLAGPALAAEPVDYARDIKPILAKHCTNCHGTQKQRAGLRLDTAKAAIDGGNSGHSIVPGKSSESLLMKAVFGTSDDVKPMPPKELPKLTAEQIALLKNWIDQGAKAPADEVAEGAKGDKHGHWSFQPVKRLPDPVVKNQAWARNSIDCFVLAHLEKDGIAPSPEADRTTLVRRVYLDLIGLPPTPAELETVLNDKALDWYEKLVDSLLNNPHYGERWGRHWLDLARYADSNGYTIDAARNIWKYRDWVIEAFNKDKPFDQFAIEQLAGDLLPRATNEQKIATGFHRNTQINQEGGIDVEQFRVEAIVDRVNTTGSVFLGLTVGCCQCHDHKFDPIAQREYFQFFAFLNNADEPTLELPTSEQLARRKELRAKIEGVEKGLRLMDLAPTNKERAWEDKLTGEAKLTFPEDIQRILGLAVSSRDNAMKQQLTAFYLRANYVPHVLAGLADPLPFTASAHLEAAAARAHLDQYRAELRKNESQVVTTMVMQERKSPRTTTIMIQGDFTRKGKEVGPGVPAVLPPLEKSQGSQHLGLTRLDLAQWLVDPRNPLTPRVTMNRFWQHFFGLGIVETENDFGTQGTPPSHPELLDWLASEFIAQKWSIKTMHRLIVTSATYRQSSKNRPDLATIDPRNRLLARQSRVRLEAEVVRDVSLASSGLLSPKIGGPSVFPPQPEGVYRFTQIPRDWKPSAGQDRYRRGLYTYFWRSAPHPGLTVFDAPDANSTCTRRNRSNTPLQALTLLNDQAYMEFAQALSGRILTDTNTSDAERIQHAFRLCLGRSPSAREISRLTDLVRQQRTGFTDNLADARQFVPAAITEKNLIVERAAWTMAARVLLNLDEFITRE